MWQGKQQSKQLSLSVRKKTKETEELVEGFPSGQMLGSPQCPTGTTEKIDDIGETEEVDRKHCWRVVTTGENFKLPILRTVWKK